MKMNKKKQHAVFTLLTVLVIFITTSILLLSTTSALADNPRYLWIKVNQNGFGSDGVNQIFALVEFKGNLYAGASTSDGTIALWKSPNGSTWTKINQLTPEPIATKYEVMDLHVFKDHLYVATAWANPAQVWRTADGITWERIKDSSFDASTNMFSVFYTFGDKLYLSSFRKIFVSETGASDTWDLSFDISSPMPCDGIWSMTEFNGQLYAGGTNIDGVKVYRLEQTGWKTVNKPGFSNPPDNLDNTEIGGFAVFQNALYTGTRNDIHGGEIWKTSNGVDWTRVKAGGLGDPSNVKVEGMIVYNQQLVVAVNNPANGLQIWSSPDGMSWTKMKDAKNDLPLNRLTHWNNAILNFQNKIYLGTLNTIRGGEIWSYPGYGMYIPIVRR
jgi:hypothetical protein